MGKSNMLSSVDRVQYMCKHLTCSENPALRDMTIAHRLPDVAIEVTWKPSFHFLFIHLNGKESLTLYDCCVYGVPGQHQIDKHTVLWDQLNNYIYERWQFWQGIHRKRTKGLTGNSDDRADTDPAVRQLARHSRCFLSLFVQVYFSGSFRW